MDSTSSSQDGHANPAGSGQPLQGLTALVTGASSGLGERFATVLAGQGAHVVIAARRLDRLVELADRIRAAGGRATPVRLDVTDLERIDAAVAEAEAAAGPIGILVNNSGVSTTEHLIDATPEQFDFTFDTNVRGAFFVAQAVARRMIERARAAASADRMPPARIINIASVAGLKVLASIGVYNMSKASVVHMTRAMALEWGRFGINVNAICPGYIRTELNDHHWDTEAGRKLIQLMPRRRLGQPDDLDGLLLLLASPQSGFINGAIMTADDGLGL